MGLFEHQNVNNVTSLVELFRVFQTNQNALVYLLSRRIYIYQDVTSLWSIFSDHLKVLAVESKRKLLFIEKCIPLRFVTCYIWDLYLHEKHDRCNVCKQDLRNNL